MFLILPLVLFAGGSWLISNGSPAAWLGTAFVCTGIAVTHSYIRENIKLEQRTRAIVFECLCLAAIVALATFMLKNAATGDRPASWDHIIHYYRTWFLKTHLLPEGRLWGWSHYAMAGYPAGYHYPFLTDLAAALLCYAGFGAISLSAAYGVTVWFGFVVMGFSVFRLGTLAFNRGVGLIAALSFMIDGGRHPQGGWGMMMTIGVWPILFSIAMSTLAIVALHQLLYHGRRRAIGVCGLFLGLALMSHPAQVLNLPILFGCCVAAALMSEPSLKWKQSLRPVATAVVIGILIGSLWLLPFIATRLYVHATVIKSLSSVEIGKGLAAGTFLQGTWNYQVVLGVCGAVVLLFSRRFGQVLCGLCVFVLLVCSASDVHTFFGLNSFSNYLEKIEFKRFIALTKPFWHVCVAGALYLLYKGASIASGHLKEKPKCLACSGRVFLLSLVAAPLIFPFSQQVYESQINRRVEYNSDRVYQIERKALIKWLNEKIADDERFFRVAVPYLRTGHHVFVDLGTEINRPIYKKAAEVAIHFRYRANAFDAWFFDLLNVRYVVSVDKISEPSLKLVNRFGKLQVYESQSWPQKPVRVVDGAGEVEMLEFGNNQISFEVKEGASGSLVLLVPYFPRWQASCDGVPLEIEKYRFPLLNRLPFMSVELRPGHYEFRFVTGWPEKLAVLLFSVGIALAGWLILSGKGSARGSSPNQA